MFQLQWRRTTITSSWFWALWAFIGETANAFWKIKRSFSDETALNSSDRVWGAISGVLTSLLSFYATSQVVVEPFLTPSPQWLAAVLRKSLVCTCLRWYSGSFADITYVKSKVDFVEEKYLIPRRCSYQQPKGRATVHCWLPEPPAEQGPQPWQLWAGDQSSISPMTSLMTDGRSWVNPAWCRCLPRLWDVHAELRQHDPAHRPASATAAVKKAPPTTQRGMPKGLWEAAHHHWLEQAFWHHHHQQRQCPHRLQQHRHIHTQHSQHFYHYLSSQLQWHLPQSIHHLNQQRRTTRQASSLQGVPKGASFSSTSQRSTSCTCTTRRISTTTSTSQTTTSISLRSCCSTWSSCSTSSTWRNTTASARRRLHHRARRPSAAQAHRRCHISRWHRLGQATPRATQAQDCGLLLWVFWGREHGSLLCAYEPASRRTSWLVTHWQCRIAAGCTSWRWMDGLPTISRLAVSSRHSQLWGQGRVPARTDLECTATSGRSGAGRLFNCPGLMVARTYSTPITISLNLSLLSLLLKCPALPECLAGLHEPSDKHPRSPLSSKFHCNQPTSPRRQRRCNFPLQTLTWL